MSIVHEILAQQIEELKLVQCSLLPKEHLAFLLSAEHCREWEALLDGSDIPADAPSVPQAHFRINVDNRRIWFDVMIPPSYNGLNTGCGGDLPSISVNGQGISRAEQERWNVSVQEKWSEIANTQFPLYQLLILHLLPLLHDDEVTKIEDQPADDAPLSTTSKADIRLYHALLTSHHLISPNKRRSLQQWSSSLSLSGFAKVGYPGVIYCQGSEENVVGFVNNIKAMQWLALKVRFLEPVSGEQQSWPERHWSELQKVGEVVAEMKRLGREEFVLEMGIGSAGTTGKR